MILGFLIEISGFGISWRDSGWGGGVLLNLGWSMVIGDGSGFDLGLIWFISGDEVEESVMVMGLEFCDDDDDEESMMMMMKNR